MPNFCYLCRCLGHLDKDFEPHEDEDVEQKDRISYGDWLRASPVKQQRPTVRQMVFRPVSGGKGEKSLTKGESSLKGIETVWQQRVGPHSARTQPQASVTCTRKSKTWRRIQKREERRSSKKTF